MCLCVWLKHLKKYSNQYIILKKKFYKCFGVLTFNPILNDLKNDTIMTIIEVHLYIIIVSTSYATLTHWRLYIINPFYNHTLGDHFFCDINKLWFKCVSSQHSI
jgi:hypothetical protein